MTAFDLVTCGIEPFVAEVTPQLSSLEEAASTQEILIQQIEGYLSRLREAMCTDLQSIVDNCCNGGGASSFLELSDTPGSYVGEANNVASVNAGETALEFTTPGGGGGLPDLVAGTEVASGRTLAGADSYYLLTDVGGMPNNTVKSVAHGIGVSFRCVSIWGVMRNSSTDDNRPLPYVSQTAATSQIALLVTSTDIVLATNSNFSAWDQGWVLLEYTKP